MESDDAQLLRESRRRPDAFVEVCERHAPQLLVWLRREAGEAVAEDLLAEALSRAWFARGRFRDPGDGSAGAWLHGIARNLVRDYRRRGAIETRARRRLGLPDGEPAGFADAEERISAEARYAGIAPLVAELPGEQREALRMRVVDELGYDEIGRRLEINAVTARTRVHRALKTLRRLTERSEV
jgi:RNA polymerase sigma factor (sigma-70 family)